MQWVLNTVGIHGWANLGGMADLIGLAMFVLLCGLLVKAARGKLA